LKKGTCQCWDFRTTLLPCKHFCTVLKLPDVSWEDVNRSFRDQAKFTGWKFVDHGSPRRTIPDRPTSPSTPSSPSAPVAEDSIMNTPRTTGLAPLSRQSTPSTLASAADTSQRVTPRFTSQPPLQPSTPSGSGIRYEGAVNHGPVSKKQSAIHALLTSMWHEVYKFDDPHCEAVMDSLNSAHKRFLKEGRQPTQTTPGQKSTNQTTPKGRLNPPKSKKIKIRRGISESDSENESNSKGKKRVRRPQPPLESSDSDFA